MKPTNIQRKAARSETNAAPDAGRGRGGVRKAATVKRNQRGRRSNRDFAYPPGSIGRDIALRDYVHYLVEHYLRNRQLEWASGNGPARISYAAIFVDIEREFQAPTYFIPKERFGDLVKYLQRRLERTALGKSNRARGISNYMSPEEFAAAQSAQ